MAKWSKNKVETDAINGGNEFVKGGNLALNELNAIVNNSFFASEKAENAEQKVNSFVEEKGRTAVTIEGQVQPNWSADFVEAEKSKSYNLWSHSGDIEGSPGQKFITLDKPIDKGEYYITCDVSYTDTSDPLFATPIMAFYDENDNVFNSVGFRGGSIRQIILQKQALKVGFYVGSGSNPDYVYNNETYKFSNIMISTEKLSVYQAKRGAITHNEDAPVVFAERERQKSKNLFDKNTVTNGYSLDFTNGRLSTDSGWSVSDYINIKSLDSFYYTSTPLITGGKDMCFYDENKTYITYVRLPLLYGKVNVPSGAVYVRVNVKTDELDQVILSEDGAIVHDNQLKEAVEKRALIYQHEGEDVIGIESSTLTTLKEYWDLFNLDKQKTYKCYSEFNNTNFYNVVGNPISSNYVFYYIRFWLNGTSSGIYNSYEVICRSASGNALAIGYIQGGGNLDTVNFTGWTKIGG